MTTVKRRHQRATQLPRWILLPSYDVWLVDGETDDDLRRWQAGTTRQAAARTIWCERNGVDANKLYNFLMERRAFRDTPEGREAYEQRVAVDRRAEHSTPPVDIISEVFALYPVGRFSESPGTP